MLLGLGITAVTLLCHAGKVATLLRLLDSRAVVTLLCIDCIVLRAPMLLLRLLGLRAPIQRLRLVHRQEADAAASGHRVHHLEVCGGEYDNRVYCLLLLLRACVRRAQRLTGGDACSTTLVVGTLIGGEHRAPRERQHLVHGDLLSHYGGGGSRKRRCQW